MIERLTFNVDTKFAEELRAIATQDRKPLSRPIRDALGEWITTLRRCRKGEKLLSLIREKTRVDENKDRAVSFYEKIITGNASALMSVIVVFELRRLVSQGIGDRKTYLGEFYFS